MGVRANRPKMLRDCQGALIQHSQDDDIYSGTYASSTIRYHGFARPGVTEDEARWRLSKETIGTGTYDSTQTISVQFADSSNDYEHIYDDSVAFTISALTKANPGEVTTTAAHGYSTGDVIEIEGCDATEANDEFYTITKVDATKFTIGTDTSGWVGAGTTGSTYKRTYANSYTYA